MPSSYTSFIQPNLNTAKKVTPPGSEILTDNTSLYSHSQYERQIRVLNSQKPHATAVTSQCRTAVKDEDSSKVEQIKVVQSLNQALSNIRSRSKSAGRNNTENYNSNQIFTGKPSGSGKTVRFRSQSAERKQEKVASRMVNYNKSMKSRVDTKTNMIEISPKHQSFRNSNSKMRPRKGLNMNKDSEKLYALYSEIQNLNDPKMTSINIVNNTTISSNATQATNKEKQMSLGLNTQCKDHMSTPIKVNNRELETITSKVSYKNTQIRVDGQNIKSQDSKLQNSWVSSADRDCAGSRASVALDTIECMKKCSSYAKCNCGKCGYTPGHTQNTPNTSYDEAEFRLLNNDYIDYGAGNTIGEVDEYDENQSNILQSDEIESVTSNNNIRPQVKSPDIHDELIMDLANQNRERGLQNLQVIHELLTHEKRDPASNIMIKVNYPSTYKSPSPSHQPVYLKSVTESDKDKLPNIIQSNDSDRTHYQGNDGKFIKYYEGRERQRLRSAHPLENPQSQLGTRCHSAPARRSKLESNMSTDPEILNEVPHLSYVNYQNSISNRNQAVPQNITGGYRSARLRVEIPQTVEDAMLISEFKTQSPKAKQQKHRVSFDTKLQLIGQSCVK